MRILTVCVASLMAASCSASLTSSNGGSLLKRGLHLAEERQYDEAIPFFLAAARSNGETPRSVRWAAWNNLGVVLARTHQYPAALTAYGRALEHWPGAPVIRFNRGISYLQMRKYRYAEDDFRGAVRKSPVFASAWNNLGIVQIRRGKYFPALLSLQRALMRRWTSAAVWNNLGAVYLLLHRPADARKAVRHALKLNPGYVPAWRNLELMRTQARATVPQPLLVVAAKDGRTLGR